MKVQGITQQTYINKNVNKQPNFGMKISIKKGVCETFLKAIEQFQDDTQISSASKDAKRFIIKLAESVNGHNADAAQHTTYNGNIYITGLSVEKDPVTQYCSLFGITFNRSEIGQKGNKTLKFYISPGIPMNRQGLGNLASKIQSKIVEGMNLDVRLKLALRRMKINKKSQ